MSVLNTTRRRPEADGCRRQVLFGEREGAGEQAHVDIGPNTALEELLDPADLTDSREKDENIADLVVERPQHGLTGRLFQARALHHRQPAQVDRERTTDTLDDGRVAECCGQAGYLGCRRHRQQAQIRPHCGASVERERQSDICGHVAFVNFVEDHQTHSGQLWIVLKSAGQHAFGDDFDPSAAADAALVPRLVADQPADLGPKERSHPLGGGAGRQSAWFEHDDATVEPGLFDQPEWGDRRLAGSRWGDEQR